MEKPGEWRTDSGGYWRGSSARWSGGEWSGGVRGQPLSLMKANRPGRRRRAPQEESQSAGPNEPRLEIGGRQKGVGGGTRVKDGQRRAGALNSSGFFFSFLAE